MTESEPRHPPLIETSVLGKSYGSITAVRDLNISVRRGEVYGFLGPNGAGKTTTLRMLLGLVKPSSGTAKVLGEEPGSPLGLQGVGALVESPAFYPYLSGRDNLRVMARYCGVPPQRVAEVLGQVELAGRAKDKFKKYSLGMKQRLGVAAALLKDPELLILDEPTNGLDVMTTRNLREVIRRLREAGKCVLFSSHIMQEVSALCDNIVIVARGRVVASGTSRELLAASGHDNLEDAFVHMAGEGEA